MSDMSAQSKPTTWPFLVLVVTLFAIVASGIANHRSAEGAAPGSLCNTPSAVAECAGATPLAIYNQTHYAIQVGTTITSKIIGATDVTGSRVTVTIKTSSNGNIQTVGTVSGTTITFSFSAP